MSPEATLTNGAIGVVLAATGDVFLRSDDGMRQVESGAQVYRGEELVTGPGSSAEVRFADDSLLSQGADSAISLDDYIYEDAGDSASELFFKMGHGTFRMVTGKIAETNPERFKIGSPLATIGIRGTITVHEINPDGEKHGVEEIHSGKALLIQSVVTGDVVMVSSPQSIVDMSPGGVLGVVRPMTTQEFDSFREIAPASIEQEQEINEERELNDESRQDSGEQGGEGGDAEGVEGEGQAGDEGAGIADSAEGEGVEVVPEILAAAVAEGELAELGPLQDMIDEAGAELPAADDVVFSIGVEFADTGTENPNDADVFVLDFGLGDTVDISLNDSLDDSLDDPIQNVILDVVSDDDASSPANADNSDDLLDDVATAGGSTAETTLPDDPDTSVDNTSDTVDSGVGITASGDTGNDIWEGSSQDDYYDGQEGNDYIEGRPGDDTLLGGDGNDTIDGGNGSDSIFGGAGDDTLIGGQGNDYIDGGDGLDTLAFDSSSGVYVSLMSDTEAGSVGEDIVLNIENIIGTTGGDTLYGCDGANVISGGDGNDTIYGNDGDDILYGNVGNDLIYGNSGNDTMIGGLGSDTIYDGNGDDVFYYASTAEGGDFIPNFHGDFDDFMFSRDSFNASAGFVTVAGEYGGAADLDGDNGSTDTSDYFVFDGSGYLWYDDNGEGAGEASLIAVVGTDVVDETDIKFSGGDLA